MYRLVRRGPGGISSEDFSSYACSAFVRHAINRHHTGKCCAIGHESSHLSLKSSQETPTATIELPDKLYPTILCTMHSKMPNSTTTAVLHPPKAHVGLPTTSWLIPSSIDKHSRPYVGLCPSPTDRGQFHHDLRSTTFTDRQQRLFSSRVITNDSSSKPRTTRHTSKCACNLPKHRPHMECIFQHNSHR